MILDHVQLDAGVDHAHWLANEYEPPTAADVRDLPEDLETTAYLEAFWAAVEAAADHFDTQ